MFRPVRSRRSFEEALDQIVEAIVTGELRRGEQMPSERDMAVAMGISRPTLREAMRMLLEANVIGVKSRRAGTYVLTDRVPRELIASRRSRALDEIASVLQARRIVETQVAKLAGRVATDDELDALARTIELQRNSEHDHDRMLQLDQRFHLQLARASHNPVLLDIVRSLLRRSAVALDMSPRMPGDAEHEIAIHERTFRALESRDQDAIDEAMDEHMGYVEQLVASELGRDAREVADKGPRG